MIVALLDVRDTRFRLGRAVSLSVSAFPNVFLNHPGVGDTPDAALQIFRPASNVTAKVFVHQNKYGCVDLLLLQVSGGRCLL